MNVYDMMKSGMSQEEIFAAFKQECAGARETIAKEEAEAQAKAKKAETEALKAEARAHLINAVLAYTEAFDGEFEIAEEDVKLLDKMIQETEGEIENMFRMAKSMNDMFNMFKQEPKDKKTTFKIAADLDPDAIDKAIRKFLEGFN